MKEGWEYKKFEDALEKVKYTKKLQTNEFLSEGRVPIISQEEDYISGFWNNPDDAYKVEKPIVIFGDHSRVIKYVDFDFVLGADGVKILKPIESLNAKFLYHYLKWYNVPNMGYSRHYKFLKEINMPVPPLKEQQQIASELDLLSGVIEKQKAQLEELDKLAQSIFYDMFGDPVTNEKGWELRKLKELGQLGRGVSKHRPRNAPELLGGSMPLIQTGDVSNSGMYITAYSSTYSEIGVAQSKVWLAGTLCITIAANIGNCAILTFDACFPDSVVGFIANEKVALKEYVYYIFERMQSILEANAPAVAQKNINLKILDELLIPLPPLSLQQEFAAKVEAIEAMKAKVRQSLKEVETLFNERMDYYFN